MRVGHVSNTVHGAARGRSVSSVRSRCMSGDNTASKVVCPGCVSCIIPILIKLPQPCTPAYLYRRCGAYGLLVWCTTASTDRRYVREGGSYPPYRRKGPYMGASGAGPGKAGSTAGAPFCRAQGTGQGQAWLGKVRQASAGQGTAGRCQAPTTYR